jgi:hypothetical protein
MTRIHEALCLAAVLFALAGLAVFTWIIRREPVFARGKA